MRRAIGALRGRVGPERPISVVHTDLPTNDFAALFDVLATDPDSYQAGDASAFASVGRSFYEQLLPSSSVGGPVAQSGIGADSSLAAKTCPRAKHSH